MHSSAKYCFDCKRLNKRETDRRYSDRKKKQEATK